VATRATAVPAAPHEEARHATPGFVRLALDEPGTYTFFCAIHPHMTGTVTVQR